MKINNLLRLLAFTAFATTAAQAELFNFNYTGSFDSATTLGGVALGADTPFSMVTTFDSSVKYNWNTSSVNDHSNYQITALSVTIAGSTYTAITDSNLSVNINQFSIYLSGNPTSVNWFYATGFSTQSNLSFNHDAPSANTYSAPFWNATPRTNYYSISLVGIPGGLANMGFGTTTPTASITAVAVPEPAECAVVTGFAIGVFALVQRRKQVTFDR